MEISRTKTNDCLELRVSGRLDAYWADTLSDALEEALRQGADRIHVDMAEVGYMSSVGIRVLIRFYKQVQRLQGAFAVVNPSAAVRGVIELAGLEALLIGSPAAPAAEVIAPREESRHVERDGASFEIFDLDGSGFAARLIGDPQRLLGAGFGGAHCSALSTGESVLAVGLGALGRDFDDCRGRFGEFLAAGGAAAYLPADGTNVADYLVATGNFVPELRVLYAVACEGSFAKLARFEAAPGPLPLSQLVKAALDFSGADAAAIAIVAESAGLMGAALRQSPAAGSRFDFALPGVRDWLWFTPERAFARGLALVVGIAARGEINGLARFLRPLGAEPWPAGHFHAAAFSFRPLRRGRIDLGSTVASLFEGEHLHGLMHLLHDDRPITGGGESELVRGAAWIGPLRGFTAEGR